MGLYLSTHRAPLTCPAIGLLQEPQRPLVWVGTPRRLRSDCSSPSMVSRLPLLAGPGEDAESSFTELGSGGWADPDAGSCSREDTRVGSAKQQMWKVLKGVGKPQIHTGPHPT